MGLTEWTISRSSDVTNNAFGVSNTGYVSYGSFDLVHDSGDAVRPCFYLVSDVVLSGGTGTASDPYRIA